MQAKVICSYCGAESFSEARFCRQCGKEFSERSSASVTEGTTRIFDTPMASDPFMNMNEWSGAGPIDKSNTNPISIPTGKETQILATQKAKSNTGLIFGGVAAFAVIAVLALTLAFVLLRSFSVNTPVAPGQPQAPTAPQPPAPPQPPATTDLSKIIYPGAKTTAEFGNGGMILSTNDSAEKVAKWYADKLKMKPTVKTADTNVFAPEGISVVITSKGGDGTKIILSQGDDSP